MVTWYGQTDRPLCVEKHLLWVDDLLSQKGVLSCVAVEQTPVHLQIPDQCVAWADYETADVQVEEDLGISMDIWEGQRHQNKIRQLVCHQIYRFTLTIKMFESTNVYWQIKLLGICNLQMKQEQFSSTQWIIQVFSPNSTQNITFNNCSLKMI